MNSLYLALSLVTVTIHTSVKFPTPKHPHGYGLNTCSGVFISPNEILTAGHCIAESRGQQWIRTNEGLSYAVTIEKTDPLKDLALLKVVRPINHAYTSFGEPAQVTDTVYTVNSGEGFERSFNKGIVNNIITDEEFKIATILHNAYIMPGASGSGLFNDNREIVGINVAVWKGFSEAVDIYEIHAFLLRRS